MSDVNIDNLANSIDALSEIMNSGWHPSWKTELQQCAGLLRKIRQLQADARRYRRLQVIGCAPSTSEQVKVGTVLSFTGLDQFLDDDMRAHPSRGETYVHD